MIIEDFIMFINNIQSFLKVKGIEVVHQEDSPYSLNSNLLKNVKNMNIHMNAKGLLKPLENIICSLLNGHDLLYQSKNNKSVPSNNKNKSNLNNGNKAAISKSRNCNTNHVFNQEMENSDSGREQQHNRHNSLFSNTYADKVTDSNSQTRPIITEYVKESNKYNSKSPLRLSQQASNNNKHNENNLNNQFTESISNYYQETNATMKKTDGNKM